MKKCRSCQKEIDSKAKKCPYCREKQGNWAQRHPILTGILGIIVFFIVISAFGGNDTPPSESDTSTPTTEVIENSDAAQETPTTLVDNDSSETVSQKNAIRKAKSYLDFSGFSRDGLITQLEYEGFSNEDAMYAVDSVAPDWNKQAEKKAKSYLDFSGFSRDGLITQLEYEGFTTEQANYGANAVGL